MRFTRRTIFLWFWASYFCLKLSDAVCPGGYLAYKRKWCFRFRYYERESKTVEFAKADCWAFSNGMLASVDDSEQEQFLVDNFLYDEDVEYTVWIGLVRNPKNRNQFIWEDGNNSTYRHWEPGEPNMFKGEPEFCVHFDVKTVDGVKHNGWNDEPCDSNQIHGFFCRLPYDAVKLTDVQAQRAPGAPDLATTTGWAVGGSIGAVLVLILIGLLAYVGYRKWSDRCSNIPMVQLHNESA